jgi:acyl-CoA thioester hydrolase
LNKTTEIQASVYYIMSSKILEDDSPKLSEIFEYRHTVTDDEIDEQGHANNVVYISWMQDAAVAHTTSLGWSGERYKEFGFGWVARSHKIEYLRPAFVGDLIVVKTWVASMQKVTSIRRYEIVRPADGEILAKAETNWAFIDYNTGRPSRIPPEISGVFQLVNRK